MIHEQTPTWAQRAARRFPQGSNGEHDFPDDLVPVVAKAVGSRLRDGDGREYVDDTMAWGSALVGHAHPLRRRGRSGRPLPRRARRRAR